MKIEVNCREDRTFTKKLEVYALSFDPNSKTFTMPWCVGDDWGQKLRCPPLTVPIGFHFQWDKVVISYDQKADAETFCEWLVSAEAKAQEGYRTMRG